LDESKWVHVYKNENVYFLEINNWFKKWGIYISNETFQEISKDEKKWMRYLVLGISAIAITWLLFLPAKLNQWYLTNIPQTNIVASNEAQFIMPRDLNSIKFSNISWHLLKVDNTVRLIMDYWNLYNALSQKVGVVGDMGTYIEKYKDKELYYTDEEARNLPFMYIVDPKDMTVEKERVKYEQIVQKLWLGVNKMYSYNQLIPYFKLLKESRLWVVIDLFEIRDVDNFADIIDSIKLLPKSTIQDYLLNDDFINNNKVLVNHLNKSSKYNMFHSGVRLTIKWVKPPFFYSGYSSINNSIFTSKWSSDLPKVVEDPKSNIPYYTMWSNYLNPMKDKLTHYNIRYFNGESSCVYDLCFDKDIYRLFKTTDEYLSSLEKMKADDSELFAKYKNIAWLDFWLLASCVSLYWDVHGFDQKNVQRYMQIFWLTKEDFYDSIQAGYNVKSELYLQNIFPNIDLNKKVLKTYSLDDTKKYTPSSIRIDNNFFKHKYFHELWHELEYEDIIKEFSSQSLSLFEYFSSTLSNGDNWGVYYWEKWQNIYKQMYLEELENSGWLVNTLGISFYSLALTDYKTIWLEFTSENVSGLLNSPWYFAYLDLYGWSRAKYIREMLPSAIETLEKRGIFTQSDYEFFKDQARLLHKIIQKNREKKIGDFGK